MTIRAPLTEAEKQYISQRKLAGATLKQIACELDCSLETARKWWRHQRDGTRPRHCGRPAQGILSTYSASLRQCAVVLKRAHQHWGPATVKLELKRQLQLQDEELPSDARLSALFKAECPEAVQPRRQRQYPEKPPPTVTAVHQRWQVDGQENVPVGEDDVATLLNMRDPLGALMIASQAFVTTTEKGWRKLELAEVQATCRQAFAQWGLPLELQTDREVVYVGPPAVDFPSLFTLWLVGLGIQHLVIRESRPTDNAQVERNHRTLSDMTWKNQTFATLEALQAALDDHRQRYNEEFPVRAADCQGRPPLEVRPWARHSGRPFHPGMEWQLFDLGRVDAFLASHVWIRTITASGGVSVGGHLYYVGRKHCNTKVSVCFIPGKRTFRFQLEDGTLVAELPTVGLDKADIIGFMPADVACPDLFQLPLPLEGV